MEILNILRIIKKNLDKINYFVYTNNDAIYIYYNNVGNEFNKKIASMGQHIYNSFDNFYMDNNLINTDIN